MRSGMPAQIGVPPFELGLLTLQPGHKPPHKHYFFELVYVQDGTGRQCVNQNKFAYRTGHLFLMTPQDCYSFDIETTTRFCFIRFTEVFFQKDRTDPDIIDYTDWFRKLDYIFHNHSRQPGCMLKRDSDKAFVAHLIDNLIAEHRDQPMFHDSIVQEGVVTLLKIVARNVAEGPFGNRPVGTLQPVIYQLLTHIQQFIYQPERLKVEHLADTFHLAPSYVGEYFKRHTGETLQSYIVQYKLKLARTRLTYSDLTVSQIADELGFTDDSHLNRLFRKYVGSSPTAYRKAYTLLQ